MKHLKFLMGSVLTVLAMTQFAHADTFTDRKKILSDIRTTNYKARPIQVGWNPGTYNQDTLFFWGNKYWPLANHLSQKMGRMVSFVPENNRQTLLNQVRNQTYSWLYVQADVSVVAQEFGYMPVAYMTREFESVFVVPAQSPIQKTSELKGKSIGVLDNSNDMRLARYYLNVEGWNANFKNIMGGGYPELEAMLKAKKVEAVAMSRTAAADLLKRNEGEFKIFASAGSIPLGIWLAHNSVPNSEITAIVSTLETSPKDLYVSAGLKFADNEKPFAPFTKDHLKYMRAAMNYNEPDYGRQVYDPRKDAFIEFNTAFSDSQVKPELKTPNP